jgi:hypothetical protein
LDPLRYLFMVALFLASLGAPVVAEAAERSAPNAVAARLFAGPVEGGVCVAYQRDFVFPLRLGASVGLLAAGDATSNWQTLDLGVRLLEAVGKPAHEFVPALVATAGLGRFVHTEAPDGYDAHRKTLAATFGVVGELRPPQSRDHGVVLSLGVQGVAAIEQDVQNALYTDWEPYDFTVMGTFSVGYAF